LQIKISIKTENRQQKKLIENIFLYVKQKIHVHFGMVHAYSGLCKLLIIKALRGGTKCPGLSLC